MKPPDHSVDDRFIARHCRSSAVRFIRLLVLVLAALPLGSSAEEITVAKYAWEFPVVTAVHGADVLIDELRQEIQAVLDAGHLAPLNCRYADQMPSPVESHFVYQEPGRIITTLAWAYPHLGPEQQAGLRRYVARELADERFAPWGKHPMPNDLGARRELHPMERVWGAEVGFGKDRPSLHTLYGLWLYGFRTGDWPLIQSKWSEIRACYTARAAEGNLYGTLGAHVAMARLADRFGDPLTREKAVGNLQGQLQAACDFAAVERLCQTKYYREYYTARNTSSHSLYHGACFLNVSPEIVRFLGDHVREAALARHTEGKQRFPLWWLAQAPYFCRWTGDEGVGLSPEVIGMIAPLERWLVQADATTLRRHTRSVPTGRGDCYWLEMLVQAIEAHGSAQWTDIRKVAVSPAAR